MTALSTSIVYKDIFCGGGGSSLGIHQANVPVAVAVNHSELALRTHARNFKDTKHIQTNISTANPRKFPHTSALWASPSCTKHSIAEGKKRKNLGAEDLWGEVKDEIDEVEERSRATMWDVVRFTEYHEYELITVENVVDVREWRLYRDWLSAMSNLDYNYKEVYLNSMVAHPTPQTRDRIYICFWKKGNKKPDLEIRPKAYCHKCGTDREAVQSWKKPNKLYGKYERQYVYRCPKCAHIVTPYYYAAANIIDWSLPIHTIGARKDNSYRRKHKLRVITDNTRRRIKIGLEKFLNRRLNENIEHLPFLFQSTHGGREHDITTPLPTITTSRDIATVVPFISSYYGGSDVNHAITEVLQTITTRDRHSLVVPNADAFLFGYYNRGENSAAATNILKPMRTISTIPRQQYLVTPRPGYKATEEDVDNCGYRGLVSKEVQRGMAFPEDYIIEGDEDSRIWQLGNAVTPPAAKLLTERMIASLN